MPPDFALDFTAPASTESIPTSKVPTPHNLNEISGFLGDAAYTNNVDTIIGPNYGRRSPPLREVDFDGRSHANFSHLDSSVAACSPRLDEFRSDVSFAANLPADQESLVDANLPKEKTLPTKWHNDDMRVTDFARLERVRNLLSTEEERHERYKTARTAELECYLQENKVLRLQVTKLRAEVAALSHTGTASENALQRMSRKLAVAEAELMKKNRELGEIRPKIYQIQRENEQLRVKYADLAANAASQSNRETPDHVSADRHAELLARYQENMRAMVRVTEENQVLRRKKLDNAATRLEMDVTLNHHREALKKANRTIHLLNREKALLPPLIFAGDFSNLLDNIPDQTKAQILEQLRENTGDMQTCLRNIEELLRHHISDLCNGRGGDRALMLLRKLQAAPAISSEFVGDLLRTVFSSSEKSLLQNGLFSQPGDKTFSDLGMLPNFFYQAPCPYFRGKVRQQEGRDGTVRPAGFVPYIAAVKAGELTISPSQFAVSLKQLRRLPPNGIAYNPSSTTTPQNSEISKPSEATTVVLACHAQAGVDAENQVIELRVKMVEPDCEIVHMLHPTTPDEYKRWFYALRYAGFLAGDENLSGEVRVSGQNIPCILLSPEGRLPNGRAVQVLIGDSAVSHDIDRHSLTIEWGEKLDESFTMDANRVDLVVDANTRELHLFVGSKDPKQPPTKLILKPKSEPHFERLVARLLQMNWLSTNVGGAKNPWQERQAAEHAKSTLERALEAAKEREHSAEKERQRTKKMMEIMAEEKRKQEEELEAKRKAEAARIEREEQQKRREEEIRRKREEERAKAEEDEQERKRLEAENAKPPADLFQVANRMIKLYETGTDEFPVLVLRAAGCQTNADDSAQEFRVTHRPGTDDEETYFFAFEDPAIYSSKKALLQENGFFDRDETASSLQDNQVCLVQKGRIDMYKSYGSPGAVPVITMLANQTEATADKARRVLKLSQKNSLGKIERITLDCANDDEFSRWHVALLFGGFLKGKGPHGEEAKARRLHHLSRYIFPVSFFGPSEDEPRCVRVAPDNSAIEIYALPEDEKPIFTMPKARCEVHSDITLRRFRFYVNRGSPFEERLDVITHLASEFDRLQRILTAAGFGPRPAGKYTGKNVQRPLIMVKRMIMQIYPDMKVNKTAMVVRGLQYYGKVEGDMVTVGLRGPGVDADESTEARREKLRFAENGLQTPLLNHGAPELHFRVPRLHELACWEFAFFVGRFAHRNRQPPRFYMPAFVFGFTSGYLPIPKDGIIQSIRKKLNSRRSSLAGNHSEFNMLGPSRASSSLLPPQPGFNSPPHKVVRNLARRKSSMLKGTEFMQEEPPSPNERRKGKVGFRLRTLDDSMLEAGAESPPLSSSKAAVAFRLKSRDSLLDFSKGGFKVTKKSSKFGKDHRISLDTAQI